MRICVFDIPVFKIKMLLIFVKAGLVAQSVMSATDTLGHRDVHGLSAIDPRPRQWICVCTMPKDVGMPL